MRITTRAWARRTRGGARPGWLSCWALFALGAGACGDEAAPPSVEALCGRQCYQIDQAACGRGGAACITDCVEGAQAVPAGCRDRRDALLACSANAEYSCGGSGPVPSGCERALSALANCLDQASADAAAADDAGASGLDGDDAGSDGDGGATSDGGPRADAGTRDAGSAVDDSGSPADGGALSCSEVCAGAFAAGCANSGACDVCEELRLLTPGSCAEELTSLETCAAGASFTCDSSGSAYAAACDPPSTDWVACVESVYPNAFGNGDVDLTVCALGDGSACGDCMRTQCCEQLAACVSDAECIALNECATPCADAACLDACDRAHPSAILLRRALFGCTVALCPAECS